MSENDRNLQNFDLPYRHQNTSNCSQETHDSHNAHTNTKPDIIPSDDNQQQISGEEILDTGYSDACSHPYIVNHLVNQPNRVKAESR